MKSLNRLSISSCGAKTCYSWRLAHRGARSGDTFTLDATLVEDTYVKSNEGDVNFDGHEWEVYIRNYSAFGRLGLVQFTLPQLPAGYKAGDILGVELSGVSAWLPASPKVMSLELLGLAVNPNLTTVTYNDLLDTSGNGVIAEYSDYAFTYGTQASSLDAMSFDLNSVAIGDTVTFPDQAGGLLGFVQTNISEAGPTTITLAIGPGDSAANACDFRFYAMENTAGASPMLLTMTFVPEPSALLLAFMAAGVLLLGRRKHETRRG